MMCVIVTLETAFARYAHQAVGRREEEREGGRKRGREGVCIVTEGL